MSEKLTEKSIAELELDDGELRTIRERLVIEKAALQSQLAALKGQIAGRLPNARYQALMRQRANCVQQLMDKERELGEVNEQRAELETVRQFRKNQVAKLKVLDVKCLVAMRDEWHGFSMDTANTAAERRLAFKFSQQVRAFLLPYFATPEVPA